MDVTLTALLAALLGGFLGAWIQTRGERRERARDRRIAAADAFLELAGEALQEARRPIHIIKTGGDRNEATDAYRKALALAQRATTRTARLDLLFGISSPTSRAAHALVRSLFRALESIQPGRESWQEAEPHHDAASLAMVDVTQHASVAVERTGRHSERLSARSRLHRD